MMLLFQFTTPHVQLHANLRVVFSILCELIQFLLRTGRFSCNINAQCYAPEHRARERPAVLGAAAAAAAATSTRASPPSAPLYGRPPPLQCYGYKHPDRIASHCIRICCTLCNWFLGDVCVCVAQWCGMFSPPLFCHIRNSGRGRLAAHV